MGVKGLWQILNSTGRPITPESLENQILAVDISIWMHQAVRGVRERRGIAVSDAHLLVMFNRICKLLFHRIKPIFVFDGPAPVLKQRLLERRRRLRTVADEKVQKLSLKLLENLVRQQAVGTVLERKNGVNGKLKSPTKLSACGSTSQEDIFALPEEVECWYCLIVDWLIVWLFDWLIDWTIYWLIDWLVLFFNKFWQFRSSHQQYTCF